jgi:hypothetical protein
LVSDYIPAGDRKNDNLFFTVRAIEIRTLLHACQTMVQFNYDTNRLTRQNSRPYAMPRDLPPRRDKPIDDHLIEVNEL